MNSAKRIVFISITTLAALSCTDTVIAEEQSASASAPDVATTPSTASLSPLQQPLASVPAEVRRNPFGSKPVSAIELAARRGGDRVFNDNQLKGVVSDNHASNLTTGMNTISDGAFSGSAGMPTVIQNSGNNVLIQNSTIVNVQLK